MKFLVIFLNILAFYSLILLTLIRLLGLISSIDFMINTKKNRFILLIIGWLCWIIAGFLPITVDLVVDQSIKEILMFINTVEFSLGVFFIFASMTSYFYELPKKFILISCLVIIILPIFTSILINFFVAMSLVIILGFGSFGVMVLFLRANKENLQNLVGKSIKWFYVGFLSFIVYLIISLILLLSVNDYSFGLFNSSNDFAVMINYSLAVYLTVLVVIIFIHFERSIVNDEMQSIKDNYSHDLGNILQTIVAALGLIEFNETLNPIEQNHINMIKEKTENASKLIKEIRNL